MHEFSLMTGVLDAVNNTAEANNATSVLEIKLVIGDMAEVVWDSMQFAFEALSPNTVSEGAALTMTAVKPRSRCAACGFEFEHDRYHWACPKCDSLATELLAGRELYIESIEIEESVS
jgi:hydrogenase nickel incorporation protein HypA/HybF